MTMLNETIAASEFLVSEANGDLSRDAAVIAAGAHLVAGAVLGRVTASGKYVRLAPAAADGSQNAAAILYGPAAAASADQRGVVISRSAEVNGNLLTWPTGITAPQRAAAIAQLAALGIIIRN